MLLTRPSVALIPLLLPAALADTIVDLGYQSYEGVSDDVTGITQWLGMRYAFPPTAEYRFAAPEDPEDLDGELTPADVVCMLSRKPSKSSKYLQYG